MTRVGTRKLKNQLGKYLDMVSRGESVVITDRGKPRAKIVPITESPSQDSSLEKILARMEAEGHLHRATRPLRPIKPVRAKGKPASQIIIEERE